MGFVNKLLGIKEQVNDVKADMPTPLIATRLNAKDGAEMVWVPEGEFLMGSADADEQKQIPEHELIDRIGDCLMGSADTEAQKFPDEAPAHTVYLDGFWMYKNVVTVKQYRTFCADIGWLMPNVPGGWWHDEHPIVCVTWNEARTYAEWAGGVLPTESEWEKAARGTYGRIYPWGNDWDAKKCCNSVEYAIRWMPMAVGKFPAGASPYGCLDMAGNVWEWCRTGMTRAITSVHLPRIPPVVRQVLQGCCVVVPGIVDLRATFALQSGFISVISAGLY